DLLHRNVRTESRLGVAFLEGRIAGVIKCPARRHGGGLLVREPHQFGIDRDRAKAVIAAVAGNHRLRRGGIERGCGSGEILIKARLAFRYSIAAAAEQRRRAKREGATAQQAATPEHWKASQARPVKIMSAKKCRNRERRSVAHWSFRPNKRSERELESIITMLKVNPTIDSRGQLH